MRSLILAMVLILIPAAAAAGTHWERWTGKGWRQQGHPHGSLIPPRVDTAGGRQCRGDLLRQVTITRHARQGQCVEVVSYDYWCRLRDGAKVVDVPARQAPSCEPTRAVDCRRPL